MWAIAFALVVMPVVEWRQEYWHEIASTWQTKLVTSAALTGCGFVVFLLTSVSFCLPNRGRLTGADAVFGVMVGCLAGGPLAYALAVASGISRLWAAAAVLGPFVFGALACSLFELTLSTKPFSLFKSLKSSLAFAGACVVGGFIPGALGAGIVFMFGRALESHWPDLTGYLSLSAYCVGMLFWGLIVGSDLTTPLGESSADDDGGDVP